MLTICDLGDIDYRAALQVQMGLRARRQRGEIGDHLLLLEHPPVFTTGRRDSRADFLSSLAEINAAGIDVVATERGGRVTYHGPGQVVGYVICHLGELGFSVRQLVATVEELCLRTLEDFGISGARDAEHPGIWVGRDKIAAVGMHISQQVSMHGFALNVCPDLEHYRHIIACGIAERGVTSLARILAKTGERAPETVQVKEKLARHAVELFQSKSAVNASSLAFADASDAGVVVSAKSMSTSSACCAESSSPFK